MSRLPDPSYDYDRHVPPYAQQRRTDPRIAAQVWAHLGDAQTVLNVGAGTGSYEPQDRQVTAVDPSAAMRSQRTALGMPPAVAASAEHLPWGRNAFDASMAMVTLHHWKDLAAGLAEMRRVTRGRILMLTFDPDALHLFWNAEYFPQLVEVEQARFPRLEQISALLGGTTRVIPIGIPLDCVDGFQEAYYGRPEEFLRPEVRRAQSAWGFLPPGLEEELVEAFRESLLSGEWDARHGHWRSVPVFEGALRLVVNER